jgi:hypothetical protein
MAERPIDNAVTNHLLTARMAVTRYQTLTGWGSDHHMLSASLTAPAVRGDL